MYGEFNGRDRGKASISQHCGDTEFLVVDDASNHLMQLLLQHVHGHVGLFHCCGLLLRLRQGALVHLLVLVQWYAVDLHRHGRHHIRRFLIEDEVVQDLNVNLLVADDIGSNELAATFLVEGLHGSVLDAGELANNALHFLQFDAETTNLHLTVATTDKGDIAVWQIADDVARTIDTCIFFIGGKRVLDIYFRHLFWTVQITAAYLRTANPQLTGCTYGQAMALLIDNIQASVVESLSNGDILQFLLHWIYGFEDGRFRRTIAVMQRIALGRNERGQLLATRHKMLQRVVLDGGGKLVGHLCGHEGIGNLLALKVVVQCYQVQTQFLRNDIDRSTASQSRIHIEHAGVEAIRSVGCHLVGFLQVEIAMIPMDKSH